MERGEHSPPVHKESFEHGVEERKLIEEKKRKNREKLK